LRDVNRPLNITPGRSLFNGVIASFFAAMSPAVLAYVPRISSISLRHFPSLIASNNIPTSTSRVTSPVAFFTIDTINSVFIR
jgi:hypothetical protein